MWIIEESDRGGAVRKLFRIFLCNINLILQGTQYTTELVLSNVQRNDNRFQTIICSTLDRHEKRKYIIDVICIYTH
jgi:hypothetical protein